MYQREHGYAYTKVILSAYIVITVLNSYTQSTFCIDHIFNIIAVKTSDVVVISITRENLGKMYS